MVGGVGANDGMAVGVFVGDKVVGARVVGALVGGVGAFVGVLEGPGVGATISGVYTIVGVNQMTINTKRMTHPTPRQVHLRFQIPFSSFVWLSKSCPPILTMSESNCKLPRYVQDCDGFKLFHSYYRTPEQQRQHARIVDACIKAMFPKTPTNTSTETCSESERLITVKFIELRCPPRHVSSVPYT